MPDYESILFCTDFSAHAHDAFEEASYLASLIGASLVVLHVIPGGVGESARAVPDPQRVAEESDVMDLLDSTYGSRMTEKPEMAIRHGHVTQVILDFAAEMNAGLIVIGARGIGRLDGFLTGGSVAERVAKDTSIPVLIVPGHEAAEEKERHELAHRRGIPLGRTDVGRVLRGVRHKAQRREKHERESGGTSD